MQVRYQAALHSVLLLRIIGRKNSLPGKNTHFFQKSAKRLPKRAFCVACTYAYMPLYASTGKASEMKPNGRCPCQCSCISAPEHSIHQWGDSVGHGAEPHIRNDCYSTHTMSQAPTLINAFALNCSSSQILRTKLMHTRDSPV